MVSWMMVAIALGAPIARAGDAPPCMDEAAVLGEAREAFPTRYDELQRVKMEDPVRYDRLLHSTAHVLGDPAAVQAAEHLARAEIRLEHASEALRAAGANATPAQEAELLAAAEEVVDARLNARRVRAQGMADALRQVNGEVRQLQQSREADIDAIIERSTR